MGSFWEKNKIPLAILVSASIIGVTIYLSRSQQTVLEAPTSQVSPTLIPTSTAIPTIDDTSAIKTALAQKLGMKEEDIEVTVTQNTGTHAKGGVKEKDVEVGGGYFLAAKDDQSWVIVYDGQEQPLCDDIEKYNFPIDLVPECLNANGKVVTR